MNRYEEALDDWASQFADAAAFDNELDTAADKVDEQALLGKEVNTRKGWCATWWHREQDADFTDIPRLPEAPIWSR